MKLDIEYSYNFLESFLSHQMKLDTEDKHSIWEKTWS
jgi:hypothetical protein